MCRTNNKKYYLCLVSKCCNHWPDMELATDKNESSASDDETEVSQ